MKNLKASVSVHTLYVIMAVLVIAVVGSIYVGYNLAPSTKSAYPIQPTISYISPTNATLSACIAGSNQNFLAKVGYPDYSKGTTASGAPLSQTLVPSQTISFYAQGVGTPVSGGGTVTSGPSKSSTTPDATASSSSSGGITSGNLHCGWLYLATAGDQSTYFLNGTYQQMLAGGTTLSVTAPKYAAPTATFGNSSTVTGNATARFHNWGGSGTVKGSTIYLSLQAGQYHAAEGSAVLSIASNSADISVTTVGGFSQSTSAYVPPMAFVTSNAVCPNGSSAATCYPAITGPIGTQNNQQNFIVPAFWNFQYATMTAPAGSYTLIPIAFTSTSGWAGTINEVLTFQYTPGTSFYNTTSGMLLTNQYRNPQTGANIWAPIQIGNVIIRAGW